MRHLRRVLDIERVGGVNDSFFDLGGDSLSAMRLIASVDAAFDLQLPPPHALLEAPTVRGLSQRLG